MGTCTSYRLKFFFWEVANPSLLIKTNADPHSLFQNLENKISYLITPKKMACWTSCNFDFCYSSPKVNRTKFIKMSLMNNQGWALLCKLTLFLYLSVCYYGIGWPIFVDYVVTKLSPFLSLCSYTHLQRSKSWLEDKCYR